jgi:hypothetical protein
MSRSFKEPWITDCHRSKSFYKRLANRRIRNISVDENISDGSSFRKYFPTYDICDFKYRYNPEPRLRYNYRTGEPIWEDPEPIYKYNRK